MALSDMAKVREGDIEALIPELPARLHLPAHARKPEITNLMADMARSGGARGQLDQHTAMPARPDSYDDLARASVPMLLMCGRQDPVTPLADHEAMAARVAGFRLRVIEECGHLSTIEQSQAVKQVLAPWLHDTAA